MTRWLAGGIAAAMLPTLMLGTALAETVDYEIDGEAFEGYFAAAEEPQGLVIVIHDWDGLDDYERTRADMLADMGYDAFAVDLFGAGNRPEANEDRAAATRAVLGDPDRMRELMLGAIEEARGAQRGRAPRGHGLLLRRHGDADAREHGRGRGRRRLGELPRQLPRRRTGRRTRRRSS
jgi:hypothetical protein